MANLLFRRVFDLSTLHPGDFLLGSSSATETLITMTFGTRVLTVSGVFTLTDGEVTGGTVTGISLRDGGVAQFDMTSLALDVDRFQALLADDDLAGVMAGNDRLTGTASADRLSGFDGADLLSGLGGNDALFGGAGHDTLDGGAGNDSMIGGAGDDLYRVNSTADSVTELRNGGFDRVETTLSSYTLGRNVEAVTFTGDGAFRGTGNGGDNLIRGGGGADSLSGLAGDDTLSGGNGNDTLVAGEGDDLLVGDAGGTEAFLTASTPAPSNPDRRITLTSGLPEAAPGGTTTLTGTINNAAGGNVINLAFVLDVSDSMGWAFTGTDVGDQNGDGVANARLDAAIAAFAQLVETIAALGLSDRVNIALIPFDNTSAIAATGSPVSDANGNGVADIIDAARALDHDGSTYYDAGLQSAITFFNAAPDGSNQVFFLSDGEPNGNDYSTMLERLGDPAGINAQIRALGFEAAGSYYDVLDLLDDGVLNSSAIDVTDPASLNAGLLGSQVSTEDIAGLEVWLNGTLVATLTPDQFTQTPFGWQYSVTLPGLDTTGTNVVETRLVLNDADGTTVTNTQTITVGGLASDDSLSGGGGNDTLDGGAGIDTLSGGSGDDIYRVDTSGDRIIEATGGGTDTVETTVSFTLDRTMTANVENLVLLGSDNINGTGNALANRITGNSGNNVIEGMGGADTLIGGFGSDFVSFRNETAVTVSLNSGAATLPGGGDVLRLVDFENVIGSAYADSIFGDTQDNVLIGLGGDDTLNGYGGFDTVDYSAATSGLTATLSSWGDTVRSANGAEGIDYLSSIEAVIGSRFADTLTESSYYITDNRLDGGEGNDLLTAAYGDDTLIGGAGNDTLAGGGDYGSTHYVDLVDYSAATAAISGALAGTMTGTATGRDVLSGFEHIVATGFADSITGSDVAEWIEGGAQRDTLSGAGGNDTLDGGAGIDVLSGGAGDDLFYVDVSGDQVRENAAEGNDTVIAAAGYTLADVDVENLTLTTTAGVTGTGNAADNVLISGAGSDLLIGLAGNDTLAGNAGDDTLRGGLGSDVLSGGDGIDWVDFTDLTTGVSGALTTWGDASFTAGVSILTLNGIENIAATNRADSLAGGYAANILLGNGGNDTLSGGDDNDTIDGGAGDDQLDGGSDDDLLTGGAGNDSIFGDYGYDTILGGVGDDTIDGGSYFDLVTYAALTTAGIRADLSTGVVTGEGTDHLSNVEWIIATDRNDVILWNNSSGTYTDFRFEGGAGNDSLSASDGDDTLMGGSGSDTMVGGEGSDTYEVDRSTDVVIEIDPYGYHDTVISSVSYTLGAYVENLTLSGTASRGTGNALNNALTGTAGDNTLSGDAGADTLLGGLGQDTLDAGADASSDVFQFTAVADSASGAADRVLNFNIAQDRLDLSDVDADARDSGNQSFSFLGTAAFTGTAGELRVSQSGGMTYVQGDTDGDGTADLVIELAGTLTLSAGNFYL
ncbi:hemolysin type calcium-binding protein [Rhodobacter viridis]|uniref:Hemolysin type calcium-binding protein n=1 Tax=Rhodobacter viridis TaxID=1054202 RepID=A0A318TWF0_9RHOB|nr:VWA domain-containing protein [Rhodobacter viridis]PYF09241.1 hemolysin type calcium-binding protein [Rhodobacter viridis]